MLDEARPLANLFTEAGRRVYLVGGMVRDLMVRQPLGEAGDVDLTTDALPEETKQIISPWADAIWTQG